MMRISSSSTPRFFETSWSNFKQAAMALIQVLTARFALFIITIAAAAGGVSYSELNYYLSCDDVPSLDIEGLEKLDVLKWWKGNHAKYAVLAAMVREALAPLASTKLPEETFQFHGGGLNERRYEFGPRISEMSVCYKDWIVAEYRKQHLYVHEEEDCDDNE
ncbi:Putative AC transposase [Linum grandiflorum]